MDAVIAILHTHDDMLPNPRHFSILVSNEQLYLASNCYIYRRQIHEWMEIFQMHHISIRLHLYETQKSLSSDINYRKVFSQITLSVNSICYICMHVFTTIDLPGQKRRYGGKTKISLTTITTTAYQARSLPLGVLWTPGSGGVDLCWVTSTANHRAPLLHR